MNVRIDFQSNVNINLEFHLSCANNTVTSVYKFSCHQFCLLVSVHQAYIMMKRIRENRVNSTVRSRAEKYGVRRINV